MRWIALLVVVAANVLMWLQVISPTLVTWAKVVPDGVTCGLCGAPEVQAALATAAEVGRTHMAQHIHVAAAWVAAVAALNILVVALLLFRRPAIRSNNSFKLKPLRGSA